MSATPGDEAARRFAVYAVPGSGAGDPAGRRLRDRAEQWLGRSVTGGPVQAAAPAGWTRAEVDAITASARRYGFHATLKPPFRLAPGRTRDELDAAAARFAARTAAAVIPQVALTRMGGFFALVPGVSAPSLHALADQVVRDFDEFRAPLTDAETARRNPAALSARQRDLLGRWGYPYVLEEFRFHLTLTDRIADAQRPRVEQTLRAWFADLLGATVAVDAVALFTQAGPGEQFLLHTVHPLRAPGKERDDRRDGLRQCPRRP